MYNRFVAARRRYLREHKDGIYTGMLLTGTLEPHLKEIGEAAQARFSQRAALVGLMTRRPDDRVRLRNKKPQPADWRTAVFGCGGGI